MAIKVLILKTRYTPEGEITEGSEIMMDEEFARQLQNQGVVHILEEAKEKKTRKKNKED